jgi:hypothetical protein
LGQLTNKSKYGPDIRIKKRKYDDLNKEKQDVESFEAYWLRFLEFLFNSQRLTAFENLGEARRTVNTL